MEIKASVGVVAVANSTTYIGKTEPFTDFNREAFENALMRGVQIPKNTIWDTLKWATLGIFKTNFPVSVPIKREF